MLQDLDPIHSSLVNGKYTKMMKCGVTLGAIDQTIMRDYEASKRIQTRLLQIPTRHPSVGLANQYSFYYSSKSTKVGPKIAKYLSTMNSGMTKEATRIASKLDNDQNSIQHFGLNHGADRKCCNFTNVEEVPNKYIFNVKNIISKLWVLYKNCLLVFAIIGFVFILYAYMQWCQFIRE